MTSDQKERSSELLESSPSKMLRRDGKRRRSPDPASVATEPLEAATEATETAKPARASEHEPTLSAHTPDDQPATKKSKLGKVTTTTSSHASPVPLSSENLPRFSRKKAGQTAPKPARRSRSPALRTSANKTHSPPQDPSPRSLRQGSPLEGRPNGLLGKRRRSVSPKKEPRRPTPPPQSPPRKLKRPGGASRITAAEKDLLRKRQEEREQARVKEAQAIAAGRGLHDVVKEHYNAVPERGRDWRKTDSRIRGLRSFNNWVKSTIIQKFSPNDDYHQGPRHDLGWGDSEDRKGLLVLDIGCGKGGDLGKWQQAPQPVELYVGVDPADVSIQQAWERYRQMRDGGRGGDRGRGRGYHGGRNSRSFHAEFFAKDGFGEWLGEIPLIRDVGIDPDVGLGGSNARWGGGGFDVVSMMFCMHYAFESEAKARGMLRNVAGSLKKGGRFIGVIPNSDVLSDKVVALRKKSHASNDSDNDGKEGILDRDGQAKEIEWGNSIYRVRFPGNTPEDGVFRPPFGWKYSYFMEEAVEGVPEYVVPWAAFRAYVEYSHVHFSSLSANVFLCQAYGRLQPGAPISEAVHGGMGRGERRSSAGTAERANGRARTWQRAVTGSG